MTWDTFFPDLLATFVGALLGIPSGWALDRLITSRARQEEAAERTRRTREALSLAKAAIEDNQTDLTKLVDLQKGNISLAPTLNASAWEALRGELEHLSSQELKHELALYFGQIQELLAMNRQAMSYRFTVGPQFPDRGRDAAISTLIAMVPERSRRIRERGERILQMIATQ